MVYFISCPHCDVSLEILEINCKIFRCGILKSNGQQIYQHSKKEECDKLYLENKIWGIIYI